MNMVTRSSDAKAPVVPQNQTAGRGPIDHRTAVLTDTARQGQREPSAAQAEIRKKIERVRLYVERGPGDKSIAFLGDLNQALGLSEREYELLSAEARKPGVTIAELIEIYDLKLQNLGQRKEIYSLIYRIERDSELRTELNGKTVLLNALIGEINAAREIIMDLDGANERLRAQVGGVRSRNTVDPFTVPAGFE